MRKVVVSGNMLDLRICANHTDVFSAMRVHPNNSLASLKHAHGTTATTPTFTTLKITGLYLRLNREEDYNNARGYIVSIHLV